MRTKLRVIALALATAFLTLPALPAMADLEGNQSEDGISVRAKEMERIKAGLDPRTGMIASHSYEYATELACAISDEDAGGDVFGCGSLVARCDPTDPQVGPGPLTRVLRRELDASGQPMSPFTVIGLTCFPNQIPSGLRTLGMDAILRAFHLTKFAKPAVHIQPEGNLTLVTLPTYFEVSWPAAGFQPQEVDTTNLLGYQVRIRPTLEHFTYVFGDGSSFGPTTSPGGPYPNGDITKKYSKAGIYSARVDITYGGEFSVNGGAWARIPDTATVTGAPVSLTVKTARNRLVTH